MRCGSRSLVALGLPPRLPRPIRPEREDGLAVQVAIAAERQVGTRGHRRGGEQDQLGGSSHGVRDASSEEGSWQVIAAVGANNPSMIPTRRGLCALGFAAESLVAS